MKTVKEVFRISRIVLLISFFMLPLYVSLTKHSTDNLKRA